MITLEKLANHKKALEEKHEVLDKAIVRHYSRYDNDDKVKAEKLQKLKLKQEIVHIEQEMKTLGESND